MQALKLPTICLLATLASCISLPTNRHEAIELGTGDLPYGGRFFDTSDFPALSPEDLAEISTLSGIPALDARCQAIADKNNLGEKWAAFVVDSEGCNGGPCRRATTVSNMGDGQVNWVLHPSSMYYHYDHTTPFANTTDTALLNFPLLTKLTACGNPGLGLDEQWRSTGLDCDSWTSQKASSFKTVGWSCDVHVNFLNGGKTVCDAPDIYVCVSNPNTRNTPSLCGGDGECHPEKCVLPSNNVSCDCRCDCQWTGPDTSKQTKMTKFGATVAGEGMVDELEEVPVNWGNAPENCACIGNGAVPACNDQYPAPDTTNIDKFGQAPITHQDSFVFFGDSITWLGGYIDLLKNAASAANATYSNRGINGGTVKDLRDGCFRFGTNYPDFDTVMKLDKPTYVNFMIGINDVWFSVANQSEYTSILTDLVSRVKKAGVKVAISTVSVIGENQDSGFADKLQAFADAARSVGEQLDVPVSEVHAAYLNYEKQFNTLPEGGLPAGVLTIDGVHPCMGGFNACPIHTHGNMILADTISGGLLKTMGL